MSYRNMIEPPGCELCYFQTVVTFHLKKNQVILQNINVSPAKPAFPSASAVVYVFIR